MPGRNLRLRDGSRGLGFVLFDVLPSLISPTRRRLVVRPFHSESKLTARIA